MKTDIYELALKSMLGEELSVEERTRLQKRNAKYEMVRFLYMEKMKNTGLVNFQFSPGDEFEDAPTIDIVNSLLKINEQLKNAEPLDFGDASWVSNPPHTGREKTKL